MTPANAKRKSFKTRWYHRHPRFWFSKARPRAAGHQDKPEVVRFAPEAGADARPPVRIFLGTEPLQARAERVFLWSVLKRRDPSRAYEIYLMKDLKGFDRSTWTTGFTNYRYAIPWLAGASGRGIYNDVDQIYLADPSAMFDQDMGGAGILCINEEDTSVSLLDCERMNSVWRVEEARTGLKRAHFLKAIADNRVWGPLAGEWNARDAEYSAGRSKCLHFTTLRTQPWQPFPDQMRYEPHPNGDVWFALEREADAARYTPFSRARPSRGFAEAVKLIPDGAPGARESAHAREIAKLAAKTQARTALDWSAAAQDGKPRAWQGLAVEAVAAGAPPFAAPVTKRYDGVASIDAVSAMPEDDVAWLLDEIFATAERFVYVAVTIERSKTRGRSEALPADWWRLQLELAANRNPGRAWTLQTNGAGFGGSQVHSGGASAEKAA